jgi:hypothetical protein
MLLLLAARRYAVAVPIAGKSAMGLCGVFFSSLHPERGGTPRNQQETGGGLYYHLIEFSSRVSTKHKRPTHGLKVACCSCPQGLIRAFSPHLPLSPQSAWI